MSRNIRRRDLLVGAGASFMALSMAPGATAQVLQKEKTEKELYPGAGLPGGGQLDVRITASPDNPDTDVRDAARRIRPFNPESWFTEWQRVAEKNERLAEAFLKDGRKVTANEFYLRAADFYRRAVVYLPESDSRTVPTYNKLKETFDNAWKLMKPPFEPVLIPYDGHQLQAHFYGVRGAAGQKSPVVYYYQGADGILLTGSRNAGADYTARGISYLIVDGPGHGGTLRLDKVYMPPDTERVVKAVVDYLVTRPDVDANRIGIYGQSLGGYSAPRAVTVEKRVKAVATGSGSFSALADLFDYYPTIQDRVRWLIGAKDLTSARKQLAEYTLEGRVKQITCPMLIGYSEDDRVMDPRGALKLYEQATNSKSEMIAGFGHTAVPLDLQTYIPDWFAKQLGTSGA